MQRKGGGEKGSLEICLGVGALLGDFTLTVNLHFTHTENEYCLYCPAPGHICEWKLRGGREKE